MPRVAKSADPVHAVAIYARLGHVLVEMVRQSGLLKGKPGRKPKRRPHRATRKPKAAKPPVEKAPRRVIPAETPAATA